MVNPFDPEEDDLFGRTLEDHTLADRLRRFHECFDSGIRAILRDCSFRINDEDGILTFQILCPNEVVQKRLYTKREKVCNLNGFGGTWTITTSASRKTGCSVKC